MVDDLVRQFAGLKARGSLSPNSRAGYYWLHAEGRMKAVFVRRGLTEDELTELWVLYKLGGWHHVQMRLDEINGRRTMVLLNGKRST